MFLSHKTSSHKTHTKIEVVPRQIAKLSLHSTQLNFNFNFEAEIALFSDNTATLGLGDVPKVNLSRFLENNRTEKKLIS